MGMIRRFNKGAVGSCLLAARQFAQKTRHKDLAKEARRPVGGTSKELRRETTMRTAFWLAGVTALALAHPAAAADTIKIGVGR